MPLVTGHPRDLGHGFVVNRLLPSVVCRSVGPFVFLDHAGPIELQGDAARAVDVRPHPHIGLATLSYLLSGAMMHRDSLGSRQAIHPGDVNWMTAGRGISHSERFDVPGAFDAPGLELLQFWAALPGQDEEVPPAFEHHSARTLPIREATGTWMRLIAGTYDGLISPVHVYSPLVLAHVELQAGARFTPALIHEEQALYVVRGRVTHGGEEHPRGHLLVSGDQILGQTVALEDTTLIFFGGQPLGHRHLWWNFVSTRTDRIEQAKADWSSGRIPLPPDDRDEFIPLPIR